MRHYHLFLLFLLLGGALLPSTVMSQAEPEPTADQSGIVYLADDPYAPVSVALTPLDLEDIDSSLPTPGDSCGLAPSVLYTYPFDLLATGAHPVNTNTRAADDPSLSCLANSIFDGRGYRSAWYSVVPPVSGVLRVRTVTNSDYRSNYDTVIAIHSGDCGSLVELACNDDSYALLSETSAEVVQGQTYYIEVVAHNQSAGSLPPTASIEAEILPNQGWGQSDTTLLTPLTGHAVVMRGKYAYIIGGLTDLFNPFWTGGNRSGTTYRYDTETGELRELALMPAGGGPAASGYAFADAILVNNEIHMPSGFVGTDGTYEGTHWVFEIPNNLWRIFDESQGKIDPPWAVLAGTNAPGWAAMTEHRLGTERGFFVIGGITGPFRSGDASNPSAAIYQYVDNGGALSWNTLPSMINPRYAHTAVRLADGASYRICVVGGLTVVGGGDALLEGGECYFPNGAPPDFTPGWIESVGPLNIPRYMAESVVGPDGRWYVLGGIDQFGNYVAETEVFDANTGSWTISSANRSLSTPPLAWVRGGFVDKRLWLFGGQQPGGPVPVPIIQNNLFVDDLNTLPDKVYVPLINNTFDRRTSVPSALPIPLGVPYQGVFDILGDAYHILAVDIGQSGVLTIQLDNIPQGYDYDLQLYGAEKRLWRASTNLGVNPESIVQRIDTRPDIGALEPGRLYIFVIRNAPNVPPSPQPYQLLVTFQPD